MKKVFVSILFVVFWSGIVLSQDLSELEESLISDGSWGKVKIGSSMPEVEKVLGKPTKLEEVKDTIYADYFIKDILIIFSTETKMVEAIIFSRSSESKNPLFRTDKGISFFSNEEDVLRIYGEPKKINVEKNDRKLYYKGIIFNFRNNQLHAILIQDKTENKFL